MKENEYQIEDVINKLKQLIQLNMYPELFREIIYDLEELKIFRELYPDADGKGSLATNYNKGREDAIDECIAILSDDSRVETCPYAILNCMKCTKKRLEALKEKKC